MTTQLEVVDDAAALARVAADVVCGVLRATPDAVIVPATGETPLGLYAQLAARHDAGEFDASRLTVVQLDDYLGLNDGDRRSLYGWMERALLVPLHVRDDQVVRLPTDGDTAAIAEFDRDLARRGIDLAILGIGENGHLGFNEPPTSAVSDTRIVELSPETITANARYWGTTAEVPSRAITLGLRQILAARRIVVLASGRQKHDIVHRAFEGPVREDVPASLLQNAAAEVTVIVDRGAWDG